MTEEDRKEKSRERMRLYRLRHKNDPAYKARVREEKRKQLAKHTPARRKAAVNARAKRYREKHKDDHAYKEKNVLGARAWRKKNPERSREISKAWAENNHEKYLETMLKWRAAHREYNLAKSKEYAQAHAEELTAYRKSPRRKQRLKEYKIERPGYHNSLCAARRALKAAAMPTWADRKAIAAIYRAAKKKSAETGVPHHVDHIIPLKHAAVCGLHIPANLQILQDIENRRKSNRFSADLSV